MDGTTEGEKVRKERGTSKKGCGRDMQKERKEEDMELDRWIDGKQ